MRRDGSKVVETVDTLSARIISEKKHNGIGAIASSAAAEMYGLSIIGKEIEDDRQNFTRFLVISGIGNGRTVINESTADKAMVCFSLPHKVEGHFRRCFRFLHFTRSALQRSNRSPSWANRGNTCFLMSWYSLIINAIAWL
ncbi:MAG: hypothetical protein MZV63_33030 [Marinilabiliales bacterium]|nr:hypothetical protein [Marinilabiliales bacterium]